MPLFLGKAKPISYVIKYAYECKNHKPGNRHYISVDQIIEEKKTIHIGTEYSSNTLFI